MLGATDGLAASLGAPVFPRDEPIRDRCLTALTARLGEPHLTTARECGRAMRLDEAIAEANWIAEAVAASASPKHR